MSFPYTSNQATILAPVIERTPVVVTDQTGQSVSGEAIFYKDDLKQRLSIDLEIEDYDNALLALLRTAIGAVESYTRLAIQPQTVVVRYTSYEGGPLPFGPVWALNPNPVVTPVVTGSTVTFNNGTSDALTDGDFPYINGSFEAGTVSYTSGYSRAQDSIRPVPDELIGAVLEHAASSFRAGGVTGSGNPGTYWKVLAGPKRRFD
ncbi:phage gp6-like head-tail connector protein [Spirosoma foliorum]|uniref:Phage gp6-like head-tail connector protein n=1 Tax=Spirosoma foliorum TaxID=2710596 RepID=A0A7G5H2I8_9BACT|nr:phage gp6-like head-tail connector protein [Spirosoma foliorum]QMW05330.1 phage gp6-like head-tail connector protein [Spirosoma foliorum]